MKNFLIALVAILGLASCGTGKYATSKEALQGEWYVIQLYGNSVKPDGETFPFIGFDLKQNLVYGSSGCNSLSGGMHVDEPKGWIYFGNVACTQMMCEDMRFENEFLQSVNVVRRYKFNKDGTLTLMDSGKGLVMTLKRK